MEETIKNLDTLNTLNKLIIIQKDKQLSKKDSIVDIKEKQLIQTTNQIMSLNKEVVSLKKFKTAFWYIIPVVVIETLIIILK